MKYLLKFDDALATSVEYSGGKGANLSLLTQRGFPVPPGFIVTARAYRDFIQGGREVLRGVHDLPFRDPAALRAASERLRGALRQLSLPEALAAEVRAWLGEHPRGQAFSVRSSSTMEDLAGAAFTVNSLEELRAIIPRLREEFRWVQELPVIWSRDLDYYLVKIGGFMAEPLEAKDLRGIWRFVLNVNEQGAQYFQPNIAVSITHAMLHHLLHRLLLMAFDREAGRLFDGLMAYCETRTGVINKELFEMALQIRARPELEKLLVETNSRELLEQGRLSAFPEFHDRFQKFLRDHGHREMDFDIYHPTWLEVPWVVLDNLRLILHTPMDETPAQKERELKMCLQQAELELFTGLPRDLHFFFYEMLRLARLYTSLDDLEHYQTTRLSLPLRKGLRELGRRLAARGILAEPMDIFFAHWQQIDEAIEQDTEAHWQEFAGAVRWQKEAYLGDRERKPEWVLGESKKEEPVHADFLAGLPGSAGEAEGPVFVVLSADDFARFPKGSVLVARTTNPSWTPLFYSAAAVITESGGPLSHGAVTAREMRIPAVMSVKESMSRLKNGQRVRVDGAQGRVYLI